MAGSRGLLRPIVGAASVPAPAGNPFTLGVSSGDPDERSAVLWTRLTGPDGAPLPDGDIDVTWELSDDPSFAAPRRVGQRARRGG